MTFLFPALFPFIAEYVVERISTMSVPELIQAVVQAFGIPGWAVEAILRQLGFI